MHCVWVELGRQPLQDITDVFKGFGCFKSSSDDITWFLAMYELMEQIELISAHGNEAMVIVDEA